MKWYPRDGDAFIAGTIDLSLEEIGAYTLILDGIYCRDNKLPDNPELICKLLRCDPRVWRRIRQRLLELGKLRLDESGFLTNYRATSEISRAIVRMDIGRKLGRSSAEKRRKNNSTATTAPLVKTPDTLTITKEERKNSTTESSFVLTDSEQGSSSARLDGALTRPADATSENESEDKEPPGPGYPTSAELRAHYRALMEADDVKAKEAGEQRRRMGPNPDGNGRAKADASGGVVPGSLGARASDKRLVRCETRIGGMASLADVLRRYGVGTVGVQGRNETGDDAGTVANLDGYLKAKP